MEFYGVESTRPLDNSNRQGQKTAEERENTLQAEKKKKGRRDSL